MFETLLIAPLYNAFVFLIGVVPGGDVGLAIILLTLIVRAIFYPAFTASIRTQMGMQAAQPELDEINRKYKDDPKTRTERTLALFREKKIRPLAGLLALFIQIPIFIALYLVFFREGLPNIETSLLYTFVSTPANVQTNFLGMLDLLSMHNLILTALVGATQYVVTRLSLSRTPTKASTPEKEMAHRMQRNLMLYMLPGLMTVLTYTFPAGVGLYFLTGNLVSIAQEWYIKRQKTA
ncbi:MAG: membrane protein insertase YidC [Candidatus Pacebacteria bacterium]|nr:membrane protein insertase YidC [Candidatus Paceibacterota bacterium]